jgi:uncharacterized protein with PQ loop repeat
MEDIMVGAVDGVGEDVDGSNMKEFLKQFSGAAMVISFMLCYLPQIYKIIKTKSASDVSVLMIFLGISGYVFGLIYMMSTSFGIWWFLNYTSGLVTSAFLLYYWYRHKDEKPRHRKNWNRFSYRLRKGTRSRTF